MSRSNLCSHTASRVKLDQRSPKARLPLSTKYGCSNRVPEVTHSLLQRLVCVLSFGRTDASHA